LINRIFKDRQVAADNIQMDSVPLLQHYMAELNTDTLVSISSQAFRAAIDEFLQLSDHAMEGLPTAEHQRRQSVNFCWGHDHDFGKFKLQGEMGTRHIWLLSRLMDCFNALPQNLTGKRVLDVGCWTGGISLLLTKMGAEVVAIDEVKKYVDCVNFLAESFGLSNLSAQPLSLYELDKPEFFEAFDHVIFLGVIYHVSDPVIALRHLYNCLKVGGTLHLETMGLDSDQPVCRYEGPSIKRGKSGWNWFVPAPPVIRKMLSDVGLVVQGVGNGVEEGKVTGDKDPLGPGRFLAVAVKEKRFEMTRAGLSLRSIR
jgi:2-polyprenyl-3-methyl-5-hydroxy-6-metoxy-1,4-benzoquinol methylase